MYLTESSIGEIVAYPYDLETGTADWSQGKTFFKTPYEGTAPDGHCQDVEGNFWVAIFGDLEYVALVVDNLKLTDPITEKTERASKHAVTASLNVPTEANSRTLPSGHKDTIVFEKVKDLGKFPADTRAKINLAIFP